MLNNSINCIIINNLVKKINMKKINYRKPPIRYERIEDIPIKRTHNSISLLCALGYELKRDTDNNLYAKSLRTGRYLLVTNCAEFICSEGFVITEYKKEHYDSKLDNNFIV